MAGWRPDSCRAGSARAGNPRCWGTTNVASPWPLISKRLRAPANCAQTSVGRRIAWYLTRDGSCDKHRREAPALGSALPLYPVRDADAADVELRLLPAFARHSEGLRSQLFADRIIHWSLWNRGIGVQLSGWFARETLWGKSGVVSRTGHCRGRFARIEPRPQFRFGLAGSPILADWVPSCLRLCHDRDRRHRAAFA